MEANTTVTICYHCGDVCENGVVHSDNKDFCCNGCSSIYQILNQHQLNQYYHIEKFPGVKVKKNEYDYSFLDVDEIATPLLDFIEENIRVVRLFLPDIHCSSCIWLLENLNNINKGVISSQVNFLKKEALISFDAQQLSFRELAILIAQIGYPPKFDTVKKEKSNNKKNNLKLGVVFFCFGNIMLFSFPEYLNPDKNFLHAYRNFFSYLIFFFSIPILSYAAKDYLIAAYKAIKARTVNLDVPISLGIITLYFKSVYDIFSGLGPGYMDSFSGFILFLLIGKWFQNKTYEALSFDRDYNSYFPMAVTQIINGSEVIKPIKEIAKGNTLLIRNDEIIPTDAILLKGKANIDYSFVTGESTTFKKKEGELVYAGGRQIGKSITIEVLKPLNQSYLTQLWNQHIFKKKDTSLTNQINARLSEYFIVTVLFIALIAGIFWYYIDSSQIVNVVVAILIVACPCALALSIPFTFGNALRVAGKNKLYLKNAAVIEKLAKVTDIVFDKTGTLTYQNQSTIVFKGKKLIPPQKRIILSLVRNSTHPLSNTIYNHLKKEVVRIKSIDDFKEIAGKGIYGKIWGKEVYIGSKEWVGANKSLPTFSTCIYVKIDKKILGYYQVQNSYRKDLISTIKLLKKRYNLHVLSGDNENEKKHLMQYFPNKKNLLFNQQPLDKLNYIKSLQNNKTNVMMIGDGLNDAGALKQSNVGIVISEDVYNFIPACNGILDATQFNKIPYFLELGKYSLSVLKISYIISFLYNIIGLSFALTNQLSPLVAAIIMPLSSISVVAISTLLIKGYERTKN